MTTLQIVFVALSLTTAFVGLIVSGLANAKAYEMLLAVDAQRPDGQKLIKSGIAGNWLYWGLSKEYRRLFPNGTLDRQSNRLIVIGAPLFFGGLLAAMFVGPF